MIPSQSLLSFSKPSKFPFSVVGLDYAWLLHGYIRCGKRHGIPHLALLQNRQTRLLHPPQEVKMPQRGCGGDRAIASASLRMANRAGQVHQWIMLHWTKGCICVPWVKSESFPAFSLAWYSSIHTHSMGCAYLTCLSPLWGIKNSKCGHAYPLHREIVVLDLLPICV